MNTTVLGRARLWTLIAAVVLGAGLWPATSLRFALGVLLTAAWAAGGFWLLETLLRCVLVPPGRPRATGRIVLVAAGKVLLYGVAVWALWVRAFPPVSLLIGFSLLLVALVVVSTTVRRSAPPARPQPRGEDA